MIKFDCRSLSNGSTSDTNWVKYSISLKLRRRIAIKEAKSSREANVNISNLSNLFRAVNERIEEDIFMFAYDWRKINFPGKRLDTSPVFTGVYGDARSSLIVSLHRMYRWHRKDTSLFRLFKKKKPVSFYTYLSPIVSSEDLNARIETILINKFTINDWDVI